MPVRLSYDPSVRAVFAAVLPASAEVIAEPVGLRARVSWPIVVRAIGLGQIEGGEIVLAPPGRARPLLARAANLARSRVAALVVSDPLTSPERAAIRSAGIPIAVLPAETDMRHLQEDIARFIVRRRRELFELEQELHRSLVERAIVGTSVEALVVAAAAHVNKPVYFDRDGDVVVPDGWPVEIPQQLLLQCRVALLHARTACTSVPGPPPALTTPVMTGKERRGVVLLVDGTDEEQDEHETVLMELAAALSIVLARDPVLAVPNVSDILSPDSSLLETQRLRHEAEPWSCAALLSLSAMESRLLRAVLAELQLRQTPALVARQGDVLAVFAHVDRSYAWDLLLNRVGMRIGERSLRMGVSRAYSRLSGAERAWREATEALRRGETGITRFESVELRVLLGTVEGWQQFVEGKLDPLLKLAAGRTELLKTLDIYLSTGRNTTEAARVLQIHRNTLLYRLRRIRSLLGTDIEEPEEAFSLQLAYRLAEVHRLTEIVDSD